MRQPDYGKVFVVVVVVVVVVAGVVAGVVAEDFAVVVVTGSSSVSNM